MNTTTVEITQENAQDCLDMLEEAGEPAHVKLTHVDAQDFTSAQREWSFGLTNTDSAAALRRLADDIEAGNVILQKVRQINTAEVTDFGLTTLEVTYARRHHRESATHD